MRTINPRRLRTALGYLKKQALSDGCGVPASNVSRWLQGGNIPEKHYDNISKITGISLETLCLADSVIGQKNVGPYVPQEEK